MKIIIPILVGAIIGYITNWLAIKMLFRPYQEKRILGMKVPFTPGLIPKESKRIAKNVGESIANYLITPESLSKAIESESMDEKIRSSIEFSIRKTKDSNNTIKSFFNSFGKDIFKSLSIFCEEKVVIFLKKKIRSIETQVKLEELLNQILTLEYNKLENETRKLEEVLSKDIVRKLKISISINKKDILKSVKEFLNIPTVKYKIRKVIEKAAEENIPRLLTAIVTPERISDKVYDALMVQLNSPNTGDDIVFGINKVMDKLLESTVSQVLQYVDKEDIDNLSTKIINSIYHESNDLYFNIIEDNVRIAIQSIIEDIGNKPIKDLMKNVDDSSIENIVRITKDVLQRITKSKLPSIIESLNISSIVEEQINSFDVSYVEELILEITSKELKAITWLGALLGGIIGVVSPLLQSL